MAVVSMKQLLEAGVHFGHQTRRWNPKMKPFIYTERNGIHIIDLQKTVNSLEQSFKFAQDVTREGGRILFVGTKKQAQDAIAEEATRAGQPYVNQRWLGGLLTNFQTIQQRRRRLEELEEMRDTGMMERLTKKEALRLNDQIAKLSRLLGGIRTMRRLPDALFVVDTKKEHIAVHEARRLGIPVIALVDTNSDPDEVTHPIPANDDAIRAVRLLSGVIANAAYEGAQERASSLAKEEVEEGFEPEAYEGYTFEPEGYEAAIEPVAEKAELIEELDEAAASPTGSWPAPVEGQDGELHDEGPPSQRPTPEHTTEIVTGTEDVDQALVATAADAQGGDMPPAADEARSGIHPDADDGSPADAEPAVAAAETTTVE